MRIEKHHRTLICLFVLGVISSLQAHDLWIVPDAYQVVKGKDLKIRLHVGEVFPVATNPARLNRFKRFGLLNPRGERPITDATVVEKSLEATLTLNDDTAHVVLLEVLPNNIELKAEDFNKYIQGEGFTEVIEARARSGQTEAAGKERYSRYSKLLLPGKKENSFLTKQFGLELEIIPLVPPTEMKAGQAIEFQIWFQGKPLPNVRVAGGQTGDEEPNFPTVGRTDAGGKVKLSFRKSGAAFVRLIHMLPSLEADVEWRSYFGTLTFSIK